MEQQQKVAFVGNSNVGKTAIIRYLQGEEFQDDYQPTEEIDEIQVVINDNPITIFDTPGDPDLKRNIVEILKQVNAVFICFSVADIDSFDSATQWIDDIKKQIKAQLSVFLVACKADIQERDITSDQVVNFINEYPNVEYLEVSSLTEQNLDQLRDKFPQKIEEPQPSQTPPKAKISPQKSMLMKEEPLWKVYDFLFPSGRVAKLVKISDMYVKNLPIQDMLFKLQLTQSVPVVNLIGAKETNRGKFYAGIARACFNTDAIIVDNGISTGIEKYCIRRGVKLIGVAPETEIKYPNQQSNFVDPYEISNGHTHIFLLNNKEKSVFFGMEAQFKINLCKRLSEGKLLKSGQRDNQKIVHILLAEQEGYLNELQLAVMSNHPIIVVKGSQIAQEYFENYNKPNSIYSEPQFGQLLRKGHFYGLNSLDSEDIAQYVHFFLTVTPFN